MNPGGEAVHAAMGSGDDTDGEQALFGTGMGGRRTTYESDAKLNTKKMFVRINRAELLRMLKKIFPDIEEEESN